MLSSSHSPITDDHSVILLISKCLFYGLVDVSTLKLASSAVGIYLIWILHIGVDLIRPVAKVIVFNALSVSWYASRDSHIQDSTLGLLVSSLKSRHKSILSFFCTYVIKAVEVRIRVICKHRPHKILFGVCLRIREKVPDCRVNKSLSFVFSICLPYLLQLRFPCDEVIVFLVSLKSHRIKLSLRYRILRSRILGKECRSILFGIKCHISEREVTCSKSLRLILFIRIKQSSLPISGIRDCIFLASGEPSRLELCESRSRCAVVEYKKVAVLVNRFRVGKEFLLTLSQILSL